MVNVVMYSDQVIPENEKVDARLLDLMAGRGLRIGYVPSGPEPDFRFYTERQTYYAHLGLKMDLVFDLDQISRRADIEALLSCEAIHLSRGNTQAFLNRIRVRSLLEPLRNWVQDGGAFDWNKPWSDFDDADGCGRRHI